MEFNKKLYDNKNVKIFNHYFSDDLCEKYKKENVIIICDIRNLKIRKDIKKSDEIVSQDMEMQQRWYSLINPVSALFKFRLKWNVDKKDTIKYLDGDLYYQVWQGKNSTETRLVPNGKFKIYNHKNYEEILFYFNRITRRMYYDHNLDCYGHCYDCRSEIEILRNYIMKFYNKNNEKNINKCACRLGQAISKNLNKKIMRKIKFYYEI